MVQVGKESFECKVSAKRMWHGLFKDAHNCLPKAIPSKVLKVEYPLGQHGFEFPGAERIIKFHKEVSKDWHKTEKELHKDELLAEEKLHKEKFLAEEKLREDEDHAKKELHKEEGLAKEEGKKIGKDIEKEELLAKKKAEEAFGGVEKEAGEVKEKAEKVGEEAKKEEEHIKEGVGGALQKGVQYIKGAIGGAAYEVASKTEKLAEKEKEEAKKAIEIGEKVHLKEEEEVKGAEHKLGGFFKKEEVWVKEKIEEVDYEASKITIHVVAGGLIGILFKHYKHTFELKEHEGIHGSTLHWTSEFETLSEKIHVHHSYQKLKEHVLLQFHGVEDYLLKHDDYA